MNRNELIKAVKELPAAAVTVTRTYLKHKLIIPKHNRDDIKLELVALADLHTDADAFRDRTNVLRLAFSGIGYNFSPDAVIMAGDITNSAHTKEYKLLKKLCSAYMKAQRILPEIGNHDTRGTSIFPYYYEAEKLFRDFCWFCGIRTDKVYYKTVINGYYIICLGSENILQNEAYISEEQLIWLDEALTEAENDKKPVFVINHQPLNNHNGIDKLWPDGGVGKQSADIEAILEKHADKNKIVFISGHLHKMSPEYSYEKTDSGIIYLNLPSFEYDGGKAYRIIVIYDTPGYYGGFRMKPFEAYEYCRSIEALKEEYKNDIEIHLGFEAEYYPATHKKLMEMLRQLPIEYLLLGQHFVTSEENEAPSGRAGDDVERLTKYYENVIEGLETGDFLYVAHPDLINFTGKEEIFEEESRKFLIQMKKLDVPVEINRLGFSEKRNYPNDIFWQIAGQVGNKAIIGVDAHSPKHFDDTAGINGCIEIAEKNGLELVDKLPLPAKAVR